MTKNSLISCSIAALLSLAAPAEAATLISTASGNIDATATWSLVDTTGTGAYLNSETANSALTTSPVSSSTFTPGAETITEIGVKLASVAASPSGTITIKLANSTAPGSRECSATVNVADLTAVNSSPAAATADGGWAIFACAAAPNGTDAYTIQASTSVAAQVNLFSLATTNWSHLLVTNGTQVGGPAAGDKFIVEGVLTGAGTHNAFTVTIETTALVNYGNVANTLIDPSIAIGQYGTLQFASAVSTAYVAEFAGPMVVYNGGTFTVGTSGTPIPASSTATLTLNSTTEGDTGVNVRNGGTLDIVGSSGGRSVVKAKLAAPATGAVTTALTTDAATGWLAGDSVYVANSQIYSGSDNGSSYLGETVTLASNAAGTSLPLTAAVVNTHPASSLAYTSTSTGSAYSLNMYSDVVLISRNVIIQGTATNNGYLNLQPNTNFEGAWVQFAYISGHGGNNDGLVADTGPSGNFSLTNFIFLNGHGTAMVLAPSNINFGGTQGAYATTQHGTFLNIGASSSDSNAGGALTVKSHVLNPYWKIDDITIVQSGFGGSSLAFLLGSVAGQVSNISITGSTYNCCGNNVVTTKTAYDLSSQIGGGINNQFGPFTLYGNVGGYLWANVGVSIYGKIQGLYTWNERGRLTFSQGQPSVVNVDPFYSINVAIPIYVLPTGSLFTARNGVIGYTGAGAVSGAVVLDSNPGDTIVLDNMDICPVGTLGGQTFINCVASAPLISLMNDITPTGAYNGNGSTTVTLRNSSLLNGGSAYPSLMQEGFYSPQASVVQDCEACSPVKHAAWVRGGFLSYDTAITHASGYSLRMVPRVQTFSGYIAGTLLTVTNYNGIQWNQLGQFLASNGSGFVPGTVFTAENVGGTQFYSVNIPQTVGSSALPVQFQSYATGDGTSTLVRQQSAPYGQGTKIAVASGTSTAQACVWIRPSINTDGAAPWGTSAVTYNGDAPRMIVRQNPYMGVQQDTVIGTSTPTAGAWSQFCATLPAAPADGQFEVVVDADQTFTSNAGGSVNVAEWSCTNCGNANTSQFWWNGAPSPSIVPAASGGGLLVNPGMHGGFN